MYTLRSSGARELAFSRFYRHIAPLERKIEYLLGEATSPLRLQTLPAGPKEKR